MSYAIICDARQGWKLGISTLALVDRSKTKRTWWTSDSEHLIFRFELRSAAEYSLRRLRRNRARIVSYSYACSIINEQDKDIMHNEAQAEDGWDYLQECGCKD